jgi:hypothetical protein
VRDQLGIVEHGNVVDVGQNLERRSGQALTRNFAVCSDRQK